MKVTFVDPPPLDKDRVPERVLGCNYGLYPIPNVFLLSAAAVLEQAGAHVTYVNGPLEGMSRAEFDHFLRVDDSDVYAIYSVNLAKATDLAAQQAIREMRGEAPVVFLGPGPTYDASAYLADEKTLVVRGEPEETLGDLLGQEFRPSPDVPGISFLDGDGISVTPARPPIENLDMLPLPARHLVKRDDYFSPKLPQAPFTAALTGRGCPYRCVYCVPCSLNFARELEYRLAGGRGKPPVRLRSAESVINEFHELAGQGYKSVSILDDEFVLNKRRVREICAGIKDTDLKWGCLARADSLDEDVVAAMADAGCQYVDIGVESFDQEILDAVGKDLSAAAIERAVRLLKRSGIAAKVNILFGCSPRESKETIAHTLREVKRVDPDLVMFGICSPFPGTELYERAKKEQWFVSGDYYPVDVQKESVISYPNLTKEDLERAVRRANRHFFLRPRFALTQLRKVRSVGHLARSIGSLRRKMMR